MANFSKIEEIYHAAFELPEAERRAFIESSCGDDGELYREVTALIALDNEAELFIESPPDDLAAEIIAEKTSAQEIVGKTLDKYRVIERIGAGGMGEVYLAQDIKLDRKVALKILPSQFSSSRERQMRFEQEAKAISALNHRNIITIYDIERVDDISFIATEFVEGVTLREKIAAGPVSWEEAVRIGIQIASALAAAHSVGIIHRDIKPANVMARDDEDVKVLDFGLAKLTTPAGQSGSFDTRDHTNQNRIMGTINYMSPEQALGEKLDERTDIFSLGVVLYEIVSGIQPFAGSSEAAVYNSTLNKTPLPISEIKPGIPFELDRIIGRALAKNKNDRYQSAQELRQDLQKLNQLSGSLSFDSPAAAAVSQNAFSLRKTLVFVAGILLFGTIAYFAFFDRAGTFSSREAAKNYKFTQLTSDGETLMPSLSPDGKTLIFSSRRTGNWDIYFQRVGGANSVNLTQNSKADEREAVFSPDGEQIAFSSNREGASGIFLMGATGENVRKISDFGFNPAWSPDSREIAFSTSPVDDPTNRGVYPAALWKIDISSGVRQELTKSDAVQPVWSPHGDRIAYWAMDAAGIRDIKTISRDGGEPIAITSDAELDWNPAWPADGKFIYFSSNRGGSMNFWRVPVDEKSGVPSGSPEPFTTPSTFSQNLTFSRDGKVLAFAQQINTSNIYLAQFNPQTETLSQQTSVIGKSIRYDRNPSISPDGEWLAFDAVKDGWEDVFVMRRDGSGLLQLTHDVNKDRAPRWSPDGKQLAFYSDRSGRNETWVINVNGTGLQQITYNTVPYGLITFWSPDGRKMVQSVTQNYPRIFDSVFPLTEQTPVQIPSENQAEVWEMAHSWAPNGRKIAQLRLANNSEMTGIVIYDLSTNSHEVVSEFGDVPVWLKDNRRLIFADQNKILLLDTITKKTKELIGLSPTDLVAGLTISQDNGSVYFALQKKESNLWLAAIE